MALKSFEDLHDLHCNSPSQVKPNIIPKNSTNISSEKFDGLPKLGGFIGLKSAGDEPSHKMLNESPGDNIYSPYRISSGNRTKEISENLLYSQNTTLIQFTKSLGSDANYGPKQFDGTLKSNENVKNTFLKWDTNGSFEVKAKTQNTNNRIQPAATPIIRSGATRGPRCALNVVPQSTSIQNPSPQPLRSKPRPPSSTSLRNSIVVNENKSENSFREIPLRRVQSSVELRNLTFQTWCERRGKQYLEEKRKEQLKRVQEEEAARKLKAEKAKQNEEIFAKWLAKKQQQALEAKRKHLKEEEERREAEESKKQLKTEAEKAFEAWKSKKEKQRERRHSISYVNRERAAEELRARLEKSIAAELAFEAWQKQAFQRLQEARERELMKIRERENRKAEMETMRKELARTSYTQWELRKAFRNQSTKNASSNQPLVAKPPWRPTSARIDLPRP